ncbi:unnamed protein product [Wuchereria bancrofti]|uniref:Uncharacterized protein n=1 Tax=Wuchereria bancrofti TaxID=6293 RepID=A0A3P7FYA5_WUCBA|nr:unnamed protein product [Wuchereria bancrofti]
MLQTEVGEMSRDEEEILAAIEHWTKQLKQVESLLVPVTLNIMLTLIVWIGVYHTKTDSNSVFYYMLDPGHNRTTGNEIVDGMIDDSYETPQRMFFTVIALSDSGVDPGECGATESQREVSSQVNGIGCVLMLAVISFALLAMALYDYRCLVQIWLYMSCVLIIFGVFASFLVYAFN